MQAHRNDTGTIYDLDLTDIRNESRNHIVRMEDGSYKPIFCRHCDYAGVCHVLHERGADEGSGDRACFV